MITCSLFWLADFMRRPWLDTGLRTVLAVATIRGVTGSGTVEAEIRYFLSSCRDDPKVLIQAIRRHWTIENGLHWILDVTFREDDSRVRDRTAARNLAILRKIAINLMGRSRTPRISMRARRKQAAWNDEYMLALTLPRQTGPGATFVMRRL
jgi:predicted transposase YbfD/YdcC